MLENLSRQILAIQDWRHPYEIDGHPVTLAKAYFAQWHPWRWSVDLPILREALGSLSGKTILDIGCNDGWYGFQAEKEGATVVGIEGREDAFERANLLKRAMGRQNISFQLGDIEQLATINGSFDATLFYGILYHLCDPIRVLARMGEATSRIIAVQTFAHVSDREPRLYLHEEKNIDRPGAALRQNLVTRPSQSAIVAMLKAAGFEHIYRGRPEHSHTKEHSHIKKDWIWSFFYGVKGEPLSSMDAIDEKTPPWPGRQRRASSRWTSWARRSF